MSIKELVAFINVFCFSFVFNLQDTSTSAQQFALFFWWEGSHRSLQRHLINELWKDNVDHPPMRITFGETHVIMALM